MTLKEKLFCQFYTAYQFPKEAAIKAGYAENIAEKKANKLLNKNEIQQEIKNLKNNVDNQQLMHWATTVLKRIIFNNPNDAILLALKNEQLNDKQIEHMSLFTISEFKKFKDGSLEIKFIDKLKAIDNLVTIANNLQTSNNANNFLDALATSASKTNEKISTNNIDNKNVNNSENND